MGTEQPVRQRKVSDANYLRYQWPYGEYRTESIGKPTQVVRIAVVGQAKRQVQSRYVAAATIRSVAAPP